MAEESIAAPGTHEHLEARRQKAREAENLALKICAQVLATMSDGGDNLAILNAIRRCVGAREKK